VPRGREAPARGSSLRALAQSNTAAHTGWPATASCGVAKARRPRRRETRVPPDGRVPTSPTPMARATSVSATSRTVLPHVAIGGSAGGLSRALIGLVLPRQCRQDHRHHCLFPDSTIARLANARSIADRAAISTHFSELSRQQISASQDQDLGLHQRPVVTTMSATSASWASDRNGVEQVPAEPGRRRRFRQDGDRQHPRAAIGRRKSSKRSMRWSRLSRRWRDGGEQLRSIPTVALVPSPSRSGVYGDR